METSIPAGYLRSLTDAINAVTDSAKELAWATLLRMLEEGDYESPMDFYADAMEAMRPIIQSVDESAASLSAQSYDFLRSSVTGEAYGAEPYPSYSEEAIQRAFAGMALQHKDNMDAFVGEVLNRIDYEAKRAAGNTTYQNGRDDPKKPRFARVPTGAETCRFCVMLASRGFVYHSAQSAGALNHYHPNCDCRIVAGYPGMVIDGYDPDEYLREWKRMEEEGLDRLKAPQHETPLGPIDRDALVYSGMKPEYMDAIEKSVRSAPEDAKTLYQRHEANFRLANDHSKLAYFSPNDVAVRLDVDKTFSGTTGSPRAKGETWFHEFGHAIDYMTDGSEGLAVKARRYAREGRASEARGGNGFYASVRYKDGLFLKTLKSEVKSKVNAVKKERRETFDALRDSLDFNGLYEQGFITFRERNLMKRWLADQRDAYQRSGDPEDEPHRAIRASPEIKRIRREALKIAGAYEKLSDEITDLDHANNGAVSDIFEGVTKAKVSDYWGHGKSYWKNEERVAKEAFAEFYSATMNNPDEVKVIEEWFPQAKRVFDDMLRAIANGEV